MKAAVSHLLGEPPGTALPILQGTWVGRVRTGGRRGLVWEGVEAELSGLPAASVEGSQGTRTASMRTMRWWAVSVKEKSLGSFVPPSLSVLHPHHIHFILLQWMHTCEIGGVQRCKAETYCFDTGFFISFYMSYEGAENLLTDLGCYSSQSSPFNSSNSLTKALCVFY